jgi:outer membrane protein OmpA-like peptidoglycan-associated protein
VEFADLSLRPQFGTRISDLSGLIVGLSTESSSRAEVSLEGKVDQFGLARISGAIAPMGATEFTDIKAIFRNLEMKNLTPYSGKFAGRKIESGKLSLDLEYKIQQRKLKGENQIVIDNLVLGERVDSKEASNLPLDLAIALLRDSNGVIELGLPVQGSLDDPQFSYGSLIWKAIGNVLTKIATAPFRALGALLGGSGEEFEAVNFEPGEARLLPPEREKLGKLVKALEKRPQLKLTVEGRFDKARDREALADNILKLEVSKRAGMKPPGANEPLVISFTDTKVQAALDELAASAGDEAVKLRAQYLPPAGNAVTGMLQNARERLSPTARAERAAARAKYYPELFKLLQAKQAVPDIAYATLAGFRAEVIKNTLTAVNTISTDRVSVAAPQPAKASKPDQVATTLALSVK